MLEPGPVPFGREARLEFPRDLFESRGGGRLGGVAGGREGADDLDGEGEETGGVGGGGGPGDGGPLPNALRAACMAKDCCDSPPKECELGRFDVVVRAAGGFGAETGGGGGAEEGVEAEEVGCRDGGGGAEVSAGAMDGGGGGGGAAVDGLREADGGGGGLEDAGKGGGAFGGLASALELGLWSGLGGGLRRFASRGLDGGFCGCGGEDSVVCGFGRNALILGAVGGFGAVDKGNLGAAGRDVSGSDA